jgi:hypothetical protein
MANLKTFTLSTASQTGTRTGALTMRGGVRAGVYGTKAALAKLKLIEQTAYRDLGLILYRAAKQGEQVAKANAPIGDTGILQRSIHLEKKGPYLYQIVASTQDEGADREYAGYQEFGWTDRGGIWHEGRGFMRAGVQEARDSASKGIALLRLKLEAL